ncbi:MAG: ABC transporter ATP-binding protein [Rhodospirillaceae bacterium]|nr:ABC transporter ATP-binding protein [Rhodospirillaceae bacterium]
MLRLQFKGVSRHFPPKRGRSESEGVLAVDDVNVEVGDGEVVSLIGPSGCGKSTLLNLASGLDRPSKGEVFVDGAPVSGPNEHVAFMLQKDLLLPWRTVRRNIEFGQEIRKLEPDKRRRRAEMFLKRFHLDGFADHYPHELSGGMRQRAALARTMMMNPDVLLLDEPFSALDAQTKMVLQQDLAGTLADERKTAFLITHDLVEALALSDRVLVMSRRPGRIIKEIQVDIPDRDNPMERRQHERIGPMIAQLMGLLDIGSSEELV